MISYPIMAQSQWLAQFASMREAVAQTRLGQSNGTSQGYGHDIVIDDAGLTSLSSDDIWNVFSRFEQGVEKEDEGCTYFSAHAKRVQSEVNHKNIGFNPEWLRKKCTALTFRKNSGLDAGQLENQILALLTSNMQSIFSIISSI